MLVRGEWQLRDDGVVRPIVRARVGGDGSPLSEDFLVDSGADRSVLGAVLVRRAVHELGSPKLYSLHQCGLGLGQPDGHRQSAL